VICRRGKKILCVLRPVRSMRRENRPNPRIRHRISSHADGRYKRRTGMRSSPRPRWPGARHRFPRLLISTLAILFWRGLFGGGLHHAFLVLSKAGPRLARLVETRRSGWLVACLSTAGTGDSFIPRCTAFQRVNVAIIDRTGTIRRRRLALILMGCASRPIVDHDRQR